MIWVQPNTSKYNVIKRTGKIYNHNNECTFTVTIMDVQVKIGCRFSFCYYIYKFSVSNWIIFIFRLLRATASTQPEFLRELKTKKTQLFIKFKNYVGSRCNLKKKKKFEIRFSCFICLLLCLSIHWKKLILNTIRWDDFLFENFPGCEF